MLRLWSLDSQIVCFFHFARRRRPRMHRGTNKSHHHKCTPRRFAKMFAAERVTCNNNTLCVLSACNKSIGKKLARCMKLRPFDVRRRAEWLLLSACLPSRWGLRRRKVVRVPGSYCTFSSQVKTNSLYINSRHRAVTFLGILF